jgi:hypothetical protein
MRLCLTARKIRVKRRRMRRAKRRKEFSLKVLSILGTLANTILGELNQRNIVTL